MWSEKLKGQTRNQALRLVDALELSCSAAQPQKTIEYVRTDLKFGLPFVFGSDNHNATNFVEPMWVKMAEPTFQGLRQLVYEPELRVSRTAPTKVSHGWICSCSTTGGIYQNERFGFSPHLNVLIGGRGAGKSAAIDLIRFAFGVEPTDADKLRSFSRRIAGFLDGAHDVVVGIQCSDGERYVVVRSGLYAPDKKREAAFTQQPVAYQVSGDSYLELSASPLELLPVEFYAQGDVVMLADHADQQMRLIDDNIDFGDLKQQATLLEEECEELEEEIDELLETKAKLEAKTSDEGELQKRVKYLSEQLKDPIFDTYEAWTNEMNALDAYAQWITKQRTKAKLKIDSVPAHTIDATKTPQPKIMAEASTLVASVRSSLSAADKSTTATIDDAEKKLGGMRSSWDKAFAAAKGAYLQKLKDLNATNRAAAAEERAKKQKTLQEIETETKPALTKVRADLKTTVAKRSALVTKLLNVRNQIHAKRVQLVQDLNAQLKGQVIIEFEASPDRSAVADYLTDVLDGSGMQNRSAQLQALCDGLDGVAIATAIRNEDKDVLTKQGKLSAASAKLMLTDIGERELMVIERLETPTLPRVLLKRQGESQYTELDRLSVGEKCSAILSVALLNKDKPLVIDQPEDELDHAFVTESIVASIRTVKGVRQIIAATHNPNIPVLGDAEIVFRVNRTTGSGTGICEIKACGGLEIEAITEEVQLLEGGPEAFEQRGRRYGLNH